MTGQRSRGRPRGAPPTAPPAAWWLHSVSIAFALLAAGAAAATPSAAAPAPVTAAPASSPVHAEGHVPGGWAPAAALTGSARAVWERCAARLGVSFEQSVRVRRFGETRETTDRILPLVMSGEKTITTTTPWIYERDERERPVPGAYSVVVDADLRPVGVLRTTATKTVAYDAVTEDDTRYEGKPVRSLAAWRDVHVRYFGRVLKPVEREWRPDMPVTLERFEVVCRE